MENPKVEIATLHKMKAEGHPITMVTAYDFPTARLVEDAGVDTILVGDSLSNVVLGYPDTLPVTMDEMIHHLKAVARAVKRAFLIVDMPFMSYNVSVEKAVINAGRFMKEGPAQAVKIEGGDWVADCAAAMVRAGIPVVGHLGLTPQTAHFLGGYRAQGRNSDAAYNILLNANASSGPGSACWCSNVYQIAWRPSLPSGCGFRSSVSAPGPGAMGRCWFFTTCWGWPATLTKARQALRRNRQGGARRTGALLPRGSQPRLSRRRAEL